MALELPFSKKLAKQASQSTSDDLRSVLKRTSNQLSVTQALVKNNQKRLEKALTVEQSKSLFESVNNVQVEDIKKRILDGQKVSKKEASVFLKSLENVTSILDGVGSTLETTVGESLSTFKTILSSDGQDRQEVLGSIVSFLDANKVEGDGVEQLLNLQKNEELLAKTGNDTLLMLLDNIITGNKDSEPILATLSDLNDKAGLDLLNSDKLADSLNKKSSTGETFKSDFLKGGLGDSVKGGLLSFGLQQLGLGGLDGILAPVIGGITAFLLKTFSPKKVSSAFKSLTKVFNIFGKDGKVFSNLSKVFSKGKFFLKKIPILGAIVSFFSGLFNASGISGIKEEDLTIGDKIASALSGLLSGLTLGFLDAETFFPLVKSVVTGLVDFFKSAVSFLGDLFSEDVDLDGVGGAIQSVISFFSSVKSFVNEALKSQIDSLFKGDGFLSNVSEIATGIGISVKESIIGMFDTVIGSLSSVLTSAGDLKDFVLKSVFDSISGMFDFFFGADGIFSAKTFKSIASFLLGNLPFGIGEKLLSGLGLDEKEAAPAKLSSEDFLKSIQPLKEVIPLTTLKASIEADKETAANQRASAAPSPTPSVPVPIPSGGSGGISPANATTVNDITLSSIQKLAIQ